MKTTSELTKQATALVKTLLHEADEDEAANFMQQFIPGEHGELYSVRDLDLVKEELQSFSDKVIKLTAQAMRLLVERGIVEPQQSHIVAKLITFELADREYNPKLWHDQWQKKARKIKNLVNSHLSWR